MSRFKKSHGQLDKYMQETDEQMKLNHFSNEVFESTVEAAKELSVIYRKDQEVEKAGSPKKQ